MPSAAYFRIFAKIVQTRAETNLFGYAECRLFSHFCKDSAPSAAYFRIFAKIVHISQIENRFGDMIWEIIDKICR